MPKNLPRHWCIYEASRWIQITTESFECSMNARVAPRRPELILDKNIEKLPICMTSRRGLDDVHVCLQAQYHVFCQKCNQKESFVLAHIIVSCPTDFSPNFIIKMHMMRWHLHCGKWHFDFWALGPIITQIPRGDEGGGRQQSWGEPVQQQSANEPTNSKACQIERWTLMTRRLCFTCHAFGLLIGFKILAEPKGTFPYAGRSDEAQSSSWPATDAMRSEALLFVAKHRLGGRVFPCGSGGLIYTRVGLSHCPICKVGMWSSL